MGGGDKTLKTVGGTPILASIVDRMAPQCAGLLLNANGDASRFAGFGLPVVADDVAGFAGPLAGLLAGLDWLARERPEARWAVSVAGDTPFIPRDLVARLQAGRIAAAARIACATSDGRRHGVVGLWPIDIRHHLRTALVFEDQRRVKAFLARYTVADVDWATQPFDPFFNVNTPDDLTTAQAIAQHLGTAAP